MSLIFSIILSLNSFQIGNQSVDSLFGNQYRQKAIEILNQHRLKEPNCILNRLIPVIETTQYHMRSDMGLAIYAAAFPDKTSPYPTVFIDPNHHWSEREAVRTIIHEALHNAWICGPDRQIKMNIQKALPPACYLFGEIQYVSADINEALNYHLKAELAQLSNK